MGDFLIVKIVDTRSNG